MVDVAVRRLDPAVPLPSYAKAGDAGCDLVTTIDVELGPGERALVGLGTQDENYEVFEIGSNFVNLSAFKL